MRQYEFMAILDPKLSDEERATLLSEIDSDLTENGLKKVSQDVWGVRDFAYKIRGSATGFYLLYVLEGDGQGIIPVTKLLNLKKNLWRFVFVRLDDGE
jgi:small subunit ribosomal protein S6